MKRFVDKYLEFAEPLTESPREFHWYMGYMILSLCVGRRVKYTHAGSLPISPNLWMVFLGTSSLTKKSTTLRIGTDHILNQVFTGQFYKYPSEGSHEALVELLSREPVGLMAHSEFASMMNWANRDYNSGLTSLLTDLYDQRPEYTRRVGTRDKAQTFTITKPFINVVACSTMEWFGKSLVDESIIQGGFLPRFNLIIGKADKDLPMTPDPDLLLRDGLVDDLLQIRSRYDDVELNYDPVALKTYCDWYVNFKKKKITGNPSSIASFNSRRQSDLDKFAMLNCVMRGGSSMNVQDLDGAIGIIEQISEYIDEVISGKLTLNPYQVNRQKILDLIEKFGGQNGGAHKMKVLRYAKMKVRDFDEIISSLDAEGAISVDEKKGGNGKKMLSYKISQRGEEPDGS